MDLICYFLLLVLTQILRYRCMLYGGVWKHVISNPPEYMPDIVQANKRLIPFIKNRYPDAVTDDHTVNCLNKIELWYSESDQVPLTVTKYITARNGEEYPISVPVSFGTTYNFQLTFRRNDSLFIIHHITITEMLDMKQFYIYAHTIHITNGEFHKKYADLCKEVCQTNLPILSNLARNKNLELTPEQKCPLAETDNNDSHHPLHQPHKSSQKMVPQDKLEQLVSTEKENSKRTESTAINIMTYNIWNFNTYQQNGEYYQRMNRISKVLKDTSPDIIAFQEVRLEIPLGGKLGPCQMDHLISVMPEYQFIYQPAQLQGNSLEQGRTEEGVAIFSKYPIIAHDYLLLFRNQSNSADLNQRICLHAVILVPSFGQVHVFNVHFSLSHEAREEAVKQILEYMSCYNGTLVVLMGDLNAEPQEKAVRMLTSGSGMLDTWHQLYPSSDGFTFSCIENQLSKRIDYIFMRKTDSLSVQKVQVLNDKKRSDAASDHRAVMATFVLKNRDAT